MKNKKWGVQEIPNQAGKTIVITGATSGLGKEATKILASKNATVIMAVRNKNKAEIVAKDIRNKFPDSKIDILELDLNSLKSIKRFKETFTEIYPKLDVLINNAGIMMCPYSKTEDDFEIQMGTNHFGHFALTGLLMPVLLNTKNARVVVTSSIAHKGGKINFDDINWETRKYNKNQAYYDSKLANLYFMYELVRKYQGTEGAPLFTGAHPGWTKTDLDRHSGIASFLGNIIAQSVEMGTLPTLRAATDVNAKSGDYFGPKNMMEMRGYPKLTTSSELSHNQKNAKMLWLLSEKITGVKY